MYISLAPAHPHVYSERGENRDVYIRAATVAVVAKTAPLGTQSGAYKLYSSSEEFQRRSDPRGASQQLHGVPPGSLRSSAEVSG